MIYTLENIYEESLKDNPVWTSKIIGSNNKWKQYLLIKKMNIKLSNGKTIFICSGFEWDLSSVPRIFWPILPPNGDFILGALIHDWMYQQKDYIIKEWFDNDTKKARKFDDKEMFLWSSKVNTSSGFSLKKVDNSIRYSGVRLFGWTVWNSNYREKVKGMRIEITEEQFTNIKEV